MPDMSAISVSLPVLSTVKLPVARPVGSGQSTGMNLIVLLNNVDRLLRINKLTDNSASKLAKKPDAIRNLRRYVSGELKGTWSLDTLEAIATVLGTSSWELLRPPGAVPQGDEMREYVREMVNEALTAPIAPRKRKNR